MEKKKNQTLEEKPKQAIALAYDPGDTAPRILATGKGALAEKILETAREADVPVYQDEKLAKTLAKLEIGDTIPPELYEVVAEILVFVDDMDKLKHKMQKR
ncbi:MAG: EscU/YscU/HrcU family type III secretion system export apparatus switch protein [Lachnospiraceae bacterium]|nr:EscU/YscU/HrcU family type III secretion system export apparatus switch protein [Lachnospiraceae bacterium]